MPVFLWGFFIFDYWGNLLVRIIFDFRNLKHFLDTGPVLIICVANILSHSVACLSLFMMCFDNKL